MNKEKFGKISFILGIVSISFGVIECFLPLIIVGALLGITSVILGIISLKTTSRNKGITGIILGICGFLVALVWLYLYIIMK